MCVRRLPFPVALVALALAAAAPASAQEPPPVIADDVTVSGVAVGGLTTEEATDALNAFFNRPFTVTLRTRVLTVRPARLRARARVAAAVTAALAAPPRATLTLGVVVTKWTSRAWLRKLARSFNRHPVRTRLVLRRAHPRLTRPHDGRRLKQWDSRLRLVAALRAHRRRVTLPVKTLRPRVTPSDFGRVVVIKRESRRLALWRPRGAGRMRAMRRFVVAVGMPAYPTPLGSFRIVTKQRNPWWYPPDAAWAAGASPIPPGPGNPLGTRWMGLNVGSVGIHGTWDTASLGHAASHACIRMAIASAEWLFDRVRIGTPVFIVAR
jgi:hypothetical protein